MARSLPRPVSNPDPLVRDVAAVGALVRNYRAENGMPINDAADLLGVSKDVLSRLENGRAIGLDKLFLILDGFGLNLLITAKRDTPAARKAAIDSAALSSGDSPLTERS
jgi:transcriptional regulator with XRE-family HTH domain